MPTPTEVLAVGMDAAVDQEMPSKASTVLTTLKLLSHPPTAAAARARRWEGGGTGWQRALARAPEGLRRTPYKCVPSPPTPTKDRAVGMDAAVDQAVPSKASTVSTKLPSLSPPTAAGSKATGNECT